ncbi:sigma-70 family RNA polymerase sigma factor [Synechococcus sp. CCAP 1479/9]|uniref:sigma-70 family RNA polymerase sigma factor n=1 Tax=Synechococcus sp. CCAP 1479/9 TaxID=1221593 RepID=UPI001C24C7D0|nr:sigma-70 family RNA polymerase sigma factor [Synechococcus sp. CCAP 1479/9]
MSAPTSTRGRRGTSGDAVTTWMNAAAQAPLLSKNATLHLARVVQAGQQPDATPGQQRAGLRARDRLIRSNLKLIVGAARPYRHRAEKLGIPYEDLLQQGTLGLAKAVERFDPTRGYALSTVAMWWIKQEVGRLCDSGGLIRLPTYVAQLAQRARYLPAGLTDAEIMAELGVSETVYRAMRSGTLVTPRSLSTPLLGADDGDTTLADVIAAPEADHLLQADLEAAIETLREANPDALALLELEIEGANRRDLGQLVGHQGLALQEHLGRTRSQLRAAAPELAGLLAA